MQRWRVLGMRALSASAGGGARTASPLAGRLVAAAAGCAAGVATATIVRDKQQPLFSTNHAEAPKQNSKVDIEAHDARVDAEVLTEPKTSVISEFTRRYEETSGGRVRNREWKVKKSGSEVFLDSVLQESDGSEVYHHQSDRLGNMCVWAGSKSGIVTDGDSGDSATFTATRIGPGELQLEGTFDGKKVSKVLNNLNGLPWYQTIGFSLEQRMAERGHEWDKIEFCTLIKKDQKMMPMQLINIGLETIEADGGRTEAVHVELRLMGWKSSIWKTDFWFDPSNNYRWCKYAGVIGVRGLGSSSESTTELKQHEDKDN